MTSKEYLGFPADKISVTAFEGDEIAPKDTEVAKYWEEIGVPKERIYYLPKSENWWGLPTGTGPCGPDSEMFYDTGAPKCSKNCNPSCSCGKYIEVGNDVYMQYVIKNAGEKAELAKQKNVDTGMGLERLLCLINGYKTVYDSEIFAPAIKIIKEYFGITDKDLENGELLKAVRVLAEHTRTAAIIIGDGVVPSATGQGYVLRRLIRRAVRMEQKIAGQGNDLLRLVRRTVKMTEKVLTAKIIPVVSTKGLNVSAKNPEKTLYPDLIGFYIRFFKDAYPNLAAQKNKIIKVFVEEVSKFNKTIQSGHKEFEKVAQFAKNSELSGKAAFRLYETYGYPLELTVEMAAERGLTVNTDEYEAAKQKHSEESHTASAGAFRGGLADTSDRTAYLHTATHLLLAGLKKLLGEDTEQKGSNITPERLRFDFNCDHKLTADEIAFLENFVNDAIERKLPAECLEMSLDDAKKFGAAGIFAHKYGQVVKVFPIGKKGEYISCEICGGPHAKNTADLVHFKIMKEESSSAGIRRIKAVIGD